MDQGHISLVLHAIEDGKIRCIANYISCLCCQGLQQECRWMSLRQEDYRTVQEEVDFHTQDTGSWFLCISYALPSWRIPECWLRVPAWVRVALKAGGLWDIACPSRWFFFAMCLEFTGMDALCRIYGTSFMMDRTAWNPLQGDFNLALWVQLFCINEYADTDNSDDTGIINVHRYFWYICNCWEEMTSCADPHNGFADDVDTYTMHCAACWKLS